MSSKKVQERMPKTSPSSSSAYTRTPTERQPLPNRLVRLLSEARWLALAVLGAYFVLILASYHKMDPGWSHGTLVPQEHNLAARAPGCRICCYISSVFRRGGGRCACCAWSGRATAA
jgi:S-DNA-T family DNA segregation ATPase FtsK/SpoIIIE